MNSRVEEAADGEPSEQQRIDLLTAAGQRNRRFIIAVTAGLGSLMLLSVGFNLYHLFASGDSEQLQQLEQHVLRLENNVAQQQQLLDQQAKLLASQASVTLAAQQLKQDNPDSIAQVGQVLQAQEQDYQQVMDGLRLGMRDLANMLPGSRSWLADYSEVIDRAQANSKKRSAAIKAWADKAAK